MSENILFPSPEIFAKIVFHYSYIFKRIFMATQLKELISNILNIPGAWHISILENWDKIVGYLSKHTYVCSIKDDTIFLGVYDSVWMHELFLMSENLKDSINSFLGAENIKHVRLKLVPKKMIKKQYRSILEIEERIIFHTSPVSLSLTNAQELALSNIKDEELKKTLVNFLARSLQN